MTAAPGNSPRPELHRSLGLVQATALNVANMVGIGPFITIPGFLAAMHGPQALIAWVIAALLVLCDGLVWSELGAALPGSGGSYYFLSEIYGRNKIGRIVPFLFIWQFLVSGTLELASGYIAAVNYLQYPFPQLEETLTGWHMPGGAKSLAAAGALLVALLLCRHIRSLGWLGIVFCTGTLVTVLAVIVAGYAHFDRSLVTFPPDAFRIDGAHSFFGGLGGAMAIAIYDYLGYYNICHLGDEVVEPGKTIPRAVMLSIVLVAGLYLTMNLAIIGVMPWEQAMKSEFVASEFMEILYGRRVAEVFTWLILWTCAASVFALTLGYSRIPYAAARNGGFFRVFAIVHPVHRYPVVSLLTLGSLTAVFCYFPLQDVINAAVTVRILVQFIGQIAALDKLRTTRPDVRLPFRMWLYPVPSVIALVGWVFISVTAEPQVLLLALGVLVSGCLAYAIWQFVQYMTGNYHDIISGAKTGAVADLIRLGLRMLVPLYGLAVRVRNAAYDRGWQRIVRVTIPVVSLGNITAGGTGKTPLAAFVAGWFGERGVRVCFVSRGYRAGAGGLNDEARVLQGLCPEVPHLQFHDRVASAFVAADEMDTQLVILDDGFQHRRLARDLDIVLIDASNPWGFGYLLPRGLLREPLTGLSRAGLVVITRVDQVAREEVDAIRTQITRIQPACDIVEVEFAATRLIDAFGKAQPIQTLAGMTVAAFSGIGNPRAFQASLARLGCTVSAFRSFPDHHGYTPAEVDDLGHWSRSLEIDAVVCTQKDIVKIAAATVGNRPLWAIEIGTRIVAGGDVLDAKLTEIAKRIGPREARGA